MKLFVYLPPIYPYLNRDSKPTAIKGNGAQQHYLMTFMRVSTFKHSMFGAHTTPTLQTPQGQANPFTPRDPIIIINMVGARVLCARCAVAAPKHTPSNNLFHESTWPELNVLGCSWGQCSLSAITVRRSAECV